MSRRDEYGLCGVWAVALAAALVSRADGQSFKVNMVNPQASSQTPRFTVRIIPQQVTTFTVNVAPVQVVDPPSPQRSYGELRKQAVDEGKPLIVWLGYPPRNQSKDYLHWHTTSVDWGQFRGPCVIVSVPKDGDLWLKTVIYDSNPEAVKAAVEGRSFRQVTPTPSVQPQVQLRPQTFNQPASGGRLRGRSSGC